MQNSTGQNKQNTPTAPPVKPLRSASLNTSWVGNMVPARMQDLPQQPHKQRFSLTPQTLGMEATTGLNNQQSRSLTAIQQRELQPSQCSEGASPLHGFRAEHIDNRKSNPFSLGFPSATFGMSNKQSTFKSTDNQMSTNLSPPTTPTNDRRPQSAQEKMHKATSLQELSTEYYEQRVRKLRSGSDLFASDAAKINKELNDVFKRRLSEIDDKAQGDNVLQLITYKEWVEMLLKINESIIGNMEQLELDVAERLEFLQRRVNSNCRHSQGMEIMKCRNDIRTLIKFIQNSGLSEEWYMQGMSLETVPYSLFGFESEQQLNADDNSELQMRNPVDPEIVQRNKLLANIKALAIEVAEKHDEVRELKRQVVCLEDEIQKAQKKIHLKDDVIKELRNDLKRYAKQTEVLLDMPPLNLETERSDASTLVSNRQTLTPQDEQISPYESLIHNEELEQTKLKELDYELRELLEVNAQSKEHKDRQIKSLFKKLVAEKSAAYSKLDYVRHQLMELQTCGISSVEADCDSGISSKNDSINEAMILKSVGARLCNMNESCNELKKRVSKLELENGELSAKLQSEMNISKCSSVILKSLADVLGSMMGHFSYVDIYKNNPNDECSSNPFVDAIMQMQRSFKEKETQLLEMIAERNEKIDELVLASIDQKHMMGHQLKQRMNISEGEDIDNITPPPSLGGQLPISRQSQTHSQSP